MKRTREEQNKYYINYRKTTRKQINLTIPIQDAERLATELAKEGKSVSGFLKNAIYDYLSHKNG